MATMSALPHDPSAGVSEPWDLLVVGGGTAGIVASTTAAALGARVLLAERTRTGGDCLWSGCVPSKALLAAGHQAAQARASARAEGRLGVHVGGEVRVDFAAVMAHVRAAIATIEPEDSPPTLEAKGVRVRTGSVRLIGPGAAEIDTDEGVEQLAFRQVVVATGSSPVLPPTLAPAEVLTSETVWDLDELPQRLSVLGGGPVGCELAQAFARLGSEVTLVQRPMRLLPADSREASAAVLAALRADGVRVLLGVRSSDPVRSDGALRGLEVRGGDGVEPGGSEVVPHDRLLVAIGRRPRTAGLELGRLGVVLGDDGRVEVDETGRSSNPVVWAAGDVCGPPFQTHVAGTDASVTASNAVLGLRRKRDTDHPRVTFTDPEVAAVGVDVEAAETERGLHVVRRGHDHADRAVTEDETVGSSTLVLDRRGRVVGGCVIGPRAGETIGEIALAVSAGLKASALAGTTHPYPTHSDSTWNASIDEVRASLGGPVAMRAVSGLGRARRWWVDRRTD